MSTPLRDRAGEYFLELQERICAALEETDGRAAFSRDAWSRPGGGGGLTRVLAGGAVFEKGGVNTSAVHGDLPEAAARPMTVPPGPFFATGLSLVLHPLSPMVPAVHANLRYFEAGVGDAWFGGGSDLTPSYLEAEDVRHFHRTLRDACERAEPGSYAPYKRWCDTYFLIRHRGERRGVGGVFFDGLRGDLERRFAFVRSVGDAFLDAYLPVVRRRMHEPYGERERRWQLLRRGRYAEFNLAEDRGTAFGLQTGGRTESVLMSLPPLARWDYMAEPAAGSREAELVEVLREPQDWLGTDGPPGGTPVGRDGRHTARPGDA